MNVRKRVQTHGFLVCTLENINTHTYNIYHSIILYLIFIYYINIKYIYYKGFKYTTPSEAWSLYYYLYE